MGGRERSGPSLRRGPFRPQGWGCACRAGLLGLVWTGVAAGDDSEGLRVRAEIASGPRWVGEGFELRVGVVAAGRRPEVELPRVAGAEVWMIGTELQPVSVSGIGGVRAQANRFISRFRVVARRAGTLEIPPIRARLGDRSGRSRPLRVTIRRVPPEGRPAEFLGGVGRFTLRAEAAPPVVRVGQELDFRITVNGPAAWGMVERPELKRFDRLPIGLQIAPRPDELTQEPPSRTFVYRLRPTRPGPVVLPPVAIAALDPESSRYVTHVTAGVPLRVVAVAPFDPSTVDLGESVESDGRSRGRAWIAWGGSAALLLGAALGLVWVRRRRRGRRVGPTAARQYAARVARGLEAAGVGTGRGRDAASGTASSDAARRTGEQLVRYLELGVGRPPGALTPDEAYQGVVGCTGCDELAARAARLAARCDWTLYRAAPAPSGDDPDGLLEDARGLFTALGRDPISRRRGLDRERPHSPAGGSVGEELRGTGAEAR